MEEFLAKKEAEKLAKQNADPYNLNAKNEEEGADNGMLNALYPNLAKGLGVKGGKKKSYIIHPDLVEVLKTKVEEARDTLKKAKMKDKRICKASEIKLVSKILFESK